ncbi:10174_t:CDS:2, partial [Cetraspora pellucida]
TKRADRIFRKSDNNKLKQRIAKLCQNKNFNKVNNTIQKTKRQQKKITTRLIKDCQAEKANLPLHVLEMDESFINAINGHVMWPQIVDQEISKNALIQFIDETNFNRLRKKPYAICSILYNIEKYKEVPVNKINLSLLKALANLTDSLFKINFNYDHPNIDVYKIPVLLNRTGFIYLSDSRNINCFMTKNVSFELQICNTCYTYLQKNKTLPLSLANNIWIRPTLLCLQDLTIPKQLLISPGYLYINLIQLINKKHIYHKLKGYIITLPQNPGSLVNVLPLPMYRLYDYLKVVFIGKGNPPKNLLKKILQVRKSKISIALKWLFRHNILFKNYKFDNNALNLLPEGEIPESLTLTTTVINLDFQTIEHHTGYIQDPLDQYNKSTSDTDNDNSNPDKNTKLLYPNINNSIGSACELRPSGIVYVNNVPISGRELILLFFQKLINNTNQQKYNAFSSSSNKKNTKDNSLQPHIILMPHDNKSLNEYEDDFLFPAGFPVFYPYGIEGHKGRLLHVSLKQYANHLMHHISSETYNLTKSYNFERSANLIATLNANDISIAINQKQNRQLVTNPAILELLKNINSTGSKLMASPQSHSHMHSEIQAIIIRDRTPSFFITINPADLHSPITMLYAGNEIDLENLLPDNFPKSTERAQLAHLDFSAVAKYFDTTIQCIINSIIGYNNKNCGIFGRVKNYYGVVEYQDCSTPHCHMLIWLYGVPDTIMLQERLKNDKDFCQCLLQYISDIVRKDLRYLLSNGQILTNEMLKTEYMRPKSILEK